MYDVKIDKPHKRLTITLNGFLNAAETKAAADKVIAAIATLGTGFDVINDVSEFKPATPEAVQEIQRAQAAIKQAGARRVVRVVGANALTAMQFARTSKAVGYAADTAATLAEAEKLLGA